MTLMTHCLSKSGNTGKPSTARKALFSWGKGNAGSFDFREQELQSSSRESFLAFALAPAAGEDGAISVVLLERSSPGERGQGVLGAATSGGAAGALASAQLSQPLAFPSETTPG